MAQIYKTMHFKTFIVALTFALPSLAQDADLAKEISSLNQQISEVNALIEEYDGGLIVELARARREALLLAKNITENRIKSENGEASLDISVPAVEPNEARAIELLGEMASAQKRVEEAELEAKQVGGLIQALALGRVETEKLTLAQLQMGYLQAKYGIAFPAPGLSVPTTENSPSLATKGQSEPSAVDVGGQDADWADPRFPSVDYSFAPFEQAYRNKENISGWWTIAEERAAIDDSPKVTAINYSEYEPKSFGGLTALIARCIEGETAFIFLQDEFLLSDYRRNTFDMTLRIDDANAQQSRWNSLTSNKGAGLFGREAESFLRRLYGANELFVRLVEKNGTRHDASFKLAGQVDAIEAVADACGWTTIELTRADYVAIQTLLNAGGFEAGTPDGQWGSGSSAAMKRFQATIGLAETGAADRETLKKLGFAK